MISIDVFPNLLYFLVNGVTILQILYSDLPFKSSPTVWASQFVTKLNNLNNSDAVSYTHLDVYKRQTQMCA